jgi:hypothetical protein
MPSFYEGKGKKAEHHVKKCLAVDGFTAKVKASDLHLTPGITENLTKAIADIQAGMGHEAFRALLIKIDVVPAKGKEPRQTFYVGYEIQPEPGQTPDTTILQNQVHHAKDHHLIVPYNGAEYTVITHKDTK